MLSTVCKITSLLPYCDVIVKKGGLINLSFVNLIKFMLQIYVTIEQVMQDKVPFKRFGLN